MNVHADRDTLIYFSPTNERRSIGIHVDLPWSEDVKDYDAPLRAYLHLWWWQGVVALSPKGKIQKWMPETGWHAPRTYGWWSFHPARDRLCRNRIELGTNRLGKPRYFECGRRRNHRGPCYFGGEHEEVPEANDGHEDGA